MCENCNYKFSENECMYFIYESGFCKNCITSKDAESDSIFMTTYTKY
jgi:hypothetical protein